MTTTAFHMPGILQRRIDRAFSTLMAAGSGPQWDFSQPAGEAAFVSPDSVSWRVFKNPLSLFIGGVAAVILELAEPSVRDGVWQHSSFRTDALTRLQRTGLAAMMTVYGPRSRAETMIAHVVRRHGQVTGSTSEGAPYEANDPVLLDWVQATASFGFMRAYHLYAHALTAAERDAFMAEAAPGARLYGATGAPTSQAELTALFARMDARLVPSPIIGEFLDIMERVPALPGPMRPVQRLLVRAAVDMLPGGAGGAPWVGTADFVGMAAGAGKDGRCGGGSDRAEGGAAGAGLRADGVAGGLSVPAVNSSPVAAAG